MRGIYILLIKIDKTIHLKIGALGTITFPSGMYAYVGSAQNSIESRVKRHLRKEKHLFWHIDYLLANTSVEIIQVYYSTGDKTCECQTAQIITKHNKPILNFGCSDCNCNSHLFHLYNSSFLNNQLQLTLPVV